jgi:lysophospholipase L1-like esterase
MSWAVLHQLRPIVEKLLRPILVLAIAGWFLLSDWLVIPWTGIAALGLLGGTVLSTAFWPRLRLGKLVPVTLGIGWVASLAFPATLWLEKHRSHVLDLLYALLAWVVAVALFGTSLCLDRKANRKKWQGLAISWALAGGIIWLVAGYLQNDRTAFHLAILLTLALLFLCKTGFRLPYFLILAVNTLILILALLPIADFFSRPGYEFNSQLDDARRLYSYEAARRDPEAFAKWWQVYYDQFHKMVAELASSGTNRHSSVLAPYSHATFFRNQVQINNKGFRGPDIPDEKGETYRIVALGESTTFGATIEPGDKPWPEVLEQMIRERLKLRRPVQVINAGIFALTLPDNLRRFPTEILPLRPDMLISYHGINGFGLLDRAIPPLGGPRAPAYQPRSLKLLADVEYGIKMRIYRQGMVPKTPLSRVAAVAPLETDYARAYRELIMAAQTNHVRLALANFSMAVNERSDTDVIAFYRAGFPAAYWLIQANILHSMLVQQLAKEHPDIRYVDTHPNLDGEHNKFIDLIHLTQEGRNQLAENIFAGIQDILKSELGGN